MLSECFSYNSALRENEPRDSTTEPVSEFGHRLPKDDHLPRHNPW
jgi:hypothetical protein